MADIILVTETGSDIPPEIAAEYGIHMVPMHVSFGSETKDDGTFPSEEICTYYEKTGVLPQTSGSTPEDFIRVFDRLHAENPKAHILHLACSAATTCSYQSALIAAQDRDYVTSIDTKAATAGQYAVVLRVARLLRKYPDWPLERVIGAAQDLVSSIKMCVLPDELEYLRAGGRVSNAAAMCGKILGIHPLIEILDGKLQVTKKLRGKLVRVASQLTSEYVLKHDLDKEELWVFESPRLPDEVKQAVEQAAHARGYHNITWVKTGGVIATHAGPSTFGIAGFAAGHNV